MYHVIYFCPHVLTIVFSFSGGACASHRNLMYLRSIFLSVIFMTLNEVLYIPRVTTVHDDGHFVSVCVSGASGSCHAARRH